MAVASRALQLVLTFQDKASKELSRFGAKVVDNEKKIKKFGKGMSVVGAGMSFLIKQAVDQADAFEQSNIAFTTMLGSAERAKRLLEDIAQFAAATPFQLDEVEKGAKALLAFGIAEEKILPTLKSLGDVSAGLNVPMERLILNFGQVATQTKLTGREMRDFAIAGVPLLDELAKGLGVTVQEVSSFVSAGKIGFDLVEQAFINMTKEGGRFNNLMDKQSKTFSGMVSNFKDQISIFLRKAGAPLLVVGKDILQSFINILEVVANWTKKNHKLVATIAKTALALTAVMLVLGPLLIALPGLVIGIKAVAATLTFLVANPIGAAITAISVLVIGITMLIRKMNSTKSASQQISSSIDDVASSGDLSALAMDDATAAIASFGDIGLGVMDSVEDKAGETADKLKDIAETIKDLNNDILDTEAERNRKFISFRKDEAKAVFDQQNKIKDLTKNLTEKESELFKERNVKITQDNLKTHNEKIDQFRTEIDELKTTIEKEKSALSDRRFLEESHLIEIGQLRTRASRTDFENILADIQEKKLLFIKESQDKQLLIERELFLEKKKRDELIKNQVAVTDSLVKQLNTRDDAFSLSIDNQIEDMNRLTVKVNELNTSLSGRNINVISANQPIMRTIGNDVIKLPAVTVNVTGNSVRDDRDIDVVTQRVSDGIMSVLGLNTKITVR